RVRIEPEDAQRPAALAAVPRNRADRAYGQAVIAPQQHRQACGAQLFADGIVHQSVPSHDFLQMTVTLVRWQVRIARSVEIALIMHLESLRLDGALEPGDSERLGAHRGSARAGADVGRCANQTYCTAHGDQPVSRSRARGRPPSVPPYRSLGSGSRGTRSIWRQSLRSSFTRECRNRSAE